MLARVAGGRLVRHARSLCTYSERMEKTGRPISPALSIPYRFPLIAISSITVRITGVMLTIGTGGVALLGLTRGPGAPAEMLGAIADSSLATPAKFAVAFPLTYHFLGAARHAVWDLTAKGFSNSAMRSSSYALLCASGLISLALAVCSLPPKEHKK